MCVYSHLSLQSSRLSNSPVLEQLINAADEVVGIKEGSKDKDHTANLRLGDKNRAAGRDRGAQ